MIPEQLKKIPNWLRYRTEVVTGDPRPKKHNYCIATGYQWRNGDPLTTFAAVEWGLSEGEYLGWRIMKETGIACLDLDEVRNVETGEIEAEALAIVKDFQSYTEVSISGTGLHIFFTLRKPLPHGSRTHRTKNRLDGYELYHDKRFMLITGDHLPGTPEDLRDRTDIAHKVFKPSGLGEYDASYSGGKCTEDAKTVLLLIRASNAAFRFFKRFRTPAIDAEDRSGIDFGMAVTIARFSNCDKSMVEQIMRMSKRVREEWNRGDYLHRTITRACAAVENERKERRNGNV